MVGGWVLGLEGKVPAAVSVWNLNNLKRVGSHLYRWAKSHPSRRQKGLEGLSRGVAESSIGTGADSGAISKSAGQCGELPGTVSLSVTSD